MSMPNRNATPTNFGFQFQINVAIYFMFNYLKNIKSIRVEGEKQDVEITLNNENKYMIQAKSTATNLYDDKNNSTKLREALESLAEADNKNVEYLFYASNLINPLNTITNEFDGNRITTLKYSELSPQSQEKINNQIANNTSKNEVYYISKDKLVIVKIPFFGDFPEERHKFIYEEAKIALTKMGENLANRHRDIIDYCEGKFLNNSATNPKIEISKEEFCNWIILIEVENSSLLEQYIDIGISELDYDEAYRKYQNYIDRKVSSYENYTKVFSLYNRKSKVKMMTITDFVKEEKIALYNIFFSENIQTESEINEKNKLDIYISQMLSYVILKKNSIISRIEKEAAL